MIVVSKDESSRILKRIRHQNGGDFDARDVVYYQSGKTDYSRAARLIAAACDPINEARLLFTDIVFGDGWDVSTENPLPQEDRWIRFYRWRASLAEHRRACEYPGHVLEKGEDGALIQLIHFTLDLGCDALLSVKPGRNVLFFSHDDRLEFIAGFKMRVLVKQLQELGFWKN